MELLPEPVRPMIATFCPGLIEKDTSFKAKGKPGL
jgi:hypothetical protein